MTFLVLGSARDFAAREDGRHLFNGENDLLSLRGSLELWVARGVGHHDGVCAPPAAVSGASAPWRPGRRGPPPERGQALEGGAERPARQWGGGVAAGRALVDPTATPKHRNIR